MGCMGTNRDPLNRAPKMRENQQLLFGLRLRLVSRIFEEFQHPATQTKVVHDFGGFFHQIKVRHLAANKKKGFYTNQ